MKFDSLGLIEPLLRAVQFEGYTTTTPIQKLAIPHVLAGKDLLGCAQTGTGKTAAFALPILQLLHDRNGKADAHAPAHVHTPAHTRTSPQSHGGAGGAPAGRQRPIRAMILTPTRELAAQIGESFQAYGRHTGLHHTVIFGGVKQNQQVAALRKGVDILVATPGRLLDLLNQQVLSLRHVEILVLDEADRMLDMGFIHDIRRVVAQVPAQRQTLMFSATMPREIRALAGTLLRNPIEVKAPSETLEADNIQQTLCHVDQHSKGDLLEHLLNDPLVTRALVFTRTKHGADKVVKRLVHGNIQAEAIHSNKSQNARLRALHNFKKGMTRVLVASDIASRGLDVDNISHVINYDMPNEPETYVHRIGRTGRAGAAGQAISFCSDDQRDLLRAVERLLGKPIPVLKHSIKRSAAPPIHAHVAHQEHAEQGTASHPVVHRKPAVTAEGATGQVRRKTATPEQQQSQFWRGRQNRRGGHSPRRGHGG